MKKNILLAIVAAAALFCSCGKSDEPTAETEPDVKIEISGLADNKATVSASLIQGDFYGAKIVTGIRVDRLDFDYTKEVKLTQWVQENGKDIESLPYARSFHSSLTRRTTSRLSLSITRKAGPARRHLKPGRPSESLTESARTIPPENLVRT